MERVIRRTAPPPKLTISQWADKHRRLSPEASAEPGRFVTSRAEYQREMMDAISDPVFETVVFMLASQTGKTESENNAVGFFIDQDPSPILVVLPTLEMAKAWSKDRLAPMLRDTPRLKGRVKDPRSRDADVTVLHKSFPGGHITISGANSPASLASRPIRILLLDEVDRYPPSAGTEGDPISLARQRTATFWNRRIIMCSTPTRAGASRIEAEYSVSDKRKFHVPCLHCGLFQELQWKNVVWPNGSPTEARIHCDGCREPWSESDRLKSVRLGEWVKTARGNGKTAGFHLNALYSPWMTPGEVALEFVEARGDPEKMKAWTNTKLAETWDEDAEAVDGASLSSKDRTEDWGPRAPTDVKIVTCGVDVQDDRVEVERVGWGMDEESWSLEYEVIYGDPSSRELWDELDTYLLTPTQRADGNVLKVAATAIDSGGHYTQMVYRFCKDRHRRKVYAIKGAASQGKRRPVWPARASKVARGRGSNVFVVGVDAAKDVIYGRFGLRQRGPGYCHLPRERDPSWFAQVTAEVVRTRKIRGFPQRTYELPAGRRNEALDCRVYAYAVLQSLNVKWSRIRQAATSSPEPLPEEPAPVARDEPRAPRRENRPRPPRRSRRGGWLSR